MKKILIVLFCSGSFSLFAQTLTQTQLIEFNTSRNQITSKGLKTLGVWSVVNLGTSGVMYFNSTGSDRYFHQMNVVFNSVNAIIVGASLIPKQKNDLTLSKTLQWQSNTESTYIANAALDLLYSSVGLYLTERAKNDLSNHDRFNGWGNSLILQGGFLFFFDTTMYIVHKKNGKKLYKMMDNVNIGTSGLGFKLEMKF